MPHNEFLTELVQLPCTTHLPLREKVIFVDWHGVLSTEVFWSSILNNPNDELHNKMKCACRNLFTNQMDIVDAWMRGHICSENVLEELDIDTDKEILLHKLNEDCKKMSVNPKLVNVLKQFRKSNFVVIATDNMDCFYHSLDSNHEVQQNFDAVLCSSEIGVLKGENTNRFFKPWLDSHNLSFSQAVLVDDSPTNCAKFEEVGGTAILVKSVDLAIKQLNKVVI
jgi:FMN phosphatase YigB (HAD superfamily)